MKFTIAAVAMMAPMAGYAGGISTTFDDPEVIRPPEVTSWAGSYVRLSYGRQNVTRDQTIITETRTATETETPVTETCAYDESKGKHWGRKCTGLGEYAGNAELNALPQGDWTRCDASVCAWGYDDQGNVTDIWLQDYEPFTFQTGTIKEPGPDIITRAVDYISEEYDETAVSLSIGQRWQSGNVVYGGELTATRNLDAETNMFSAEGTAGYNFGAVLPYLSAGLATDGDNSGLIYGAGADLRVTDAMFVGVEVYRADDLGVEGISASVGWAF